MLEPAHFWWCQHGWDTASRLAAMLASVDTELESYPSVFEKLHWVISMPGGNSVSIYHDPAEDIAFSVVESFVRVAYHHYFAADSTESLRAELELVVSVFRGRTSLRDAGFSMLTPGEYLYQRKQA